MNKFLIISVLSVFSVACLSAQALYNKGALYVGTGTTTSLYVKGDLKLVGSATIAHKGKTVLTGDFINDVNTSNNHAFVKPESSSTRPEGTFTFKGSVAQKIYGSSRDYIQFPDSVVIEKQTSTVTIDPEIDVEVKDLKFTSGRLVLDSKATKDINDYRTTIASLKVTGTVDYNGHTQNSMVQVNLALGTGSWEEGRLIAFSSPFKKMYADYFLFNFLSKPDTTSSTISSTDALSTRMGDKWIKDPKTPLYPGEGFLLGMGLVQPWGNDYYQKTLAPSYSTAQRAEAASDSFVFARFQLHSSHSSFVEAAASITDHVTGEELNTGNVSMNLYDGYHFIGNPFTTPLDLTDLTVSGEHPDWGLADSDLEAGYHVLSAGKGSRLSSGRFSFTNTFVQVASTGGTDIRDTIAPMQAFIVHKQTSGMKTFTIPASRRVFRNNLTPYFFRSAPEPRVDELLIETKDLQTGGFDRLCVVFRKNASRTAGDTYDALKLFNRTGGVNQIYTRSSDNKDMVSNIMPSSTEQLVMYFEPSSEAQEVRLTASRLNTITSMANVVLEDRQTGRVVDLKKAPTYHFLSSPDDKTDRFILHFGSNAPVGGIGDFASPLFYAAYEPGTLWVHGIKETWTGGASVLMYDMLGRLIHSQRITEAPTLRIGKYLTKGVYVLRVTAENASAAKFVVK